MRRLIITFIIIFGISCSEDIKRSPSQSSGNNPSIKTNSSDSGNINLGWLLKKNKDETKGGPRDLSPDHDPSSSRSSQMDVKPLNEILDNDKTITFKDDYQASSGVTIKTYLIKKFTLIYLYDEKVRESKSNNTLKISDILYSFDMDIKEVNKSRLEIIESIKKDLRPIVNNEDPHCVLETNMGLSLYSRLVDTDISVEQFYEFMCNLYLNIKDEDTIFEKAIFDFLVLISKEHTLNPLSVYDEILKLYIIDYALSKSLESDSYINNKLDHFLNHEIHQKEITNIENRLNRMIDNLRANIYQMSLVEAGRQAIYMNQDEELKTLLNKGLNIYLTDDRGLSLVEYSKEQDNRINIQQEIDNKFVKAVTEDDINKMTELQNIASLFPKDEEGNSVLGIALKIKKNKTSAMMILAKAKSINDKIARYLINSPVTLEGELPLMLSINMKDQDLYLRLLDYGADPNGSIAFNNSNYDFPIPGMTTLMYIISTLPETQLSFERIKKIIEDLISYGAEVNATDIYGNRVVDYIDAMCVYYNSKGQTYPVNGDESKVYKQLIQLKKYLEESHSAKRSHLYSKLYPLKKFKGKFKEDNIPLTLLRLKSLFLPQ